MNLLQIGEKTGNECEDTVTARCPAIPQSHDSCVLEFSLLFASAGLIDLG